MKKQQNRFKVKAKAQFSSAIEKFAANYAQAMRELTPLILHKHMGASEAIVFVAMYADAVMLGDRHKAEHHMSEDDITGAVNLLLMLWKQGKVIAPAEYPYTLEQTLADGSDEV